MRRQSATTREKKSVAFNEEEIQEHDKDRGTRMKIEEPKTPYLTSQTNLEGSEVSFNSEGRFLLLQMKYPSCRWTIELVLLLLLMQLGNLASFK